MALVRALTGIAVSAVRVIPAGAEVDSNDPFVVANPQFFTRPEPVVEAATAAPGEKRAAKPRAARKAKPADA